MRILLITVFLQLSCGTKSSTNYVPTSPDSPTPAPNYIPAPEPTASTPDAPKTPPTETNKNQPPVNDTPNKVPSPGPPPTPPKTETKTSTDTVPTTKVPIPAAPVTPIAPAVPVVPVATVVPVVPKKPLAEVEIEKLTNVVFNDQFYEVIEDGYRTGVAMGECPETSELITPTTRCVTLEWSGWSPGVGYSNISGYITSTPEKAKLWRNTKTFSDGSSLDLHIITYKGKVLGVEGYISGDAKLLINVEYNGKYYRRYTKLPIGLSMDPMCTNSLTHPGWVGFGTCS